MATDESNLSNEFLARNWIKSMTIIVEGDGAEDALILKVTDSDRAKRLFKVVSSVVLAEKAGDAGERSDGSGSERRLGHAKDGAFHVSPLHERRMDAGEGGVLGFETFGLSESQIEAVVGDYYSKMPLKPLAQTLGIAPGQLVTLLKQRASPRVIRETPDEEDREEMRRRYVEEGHSLMTVADALGYSIFTVREHLVAQGVDTSRRYKRAG